MSRCKRCGGAGTDFGEPPGDCPRCKGTGEACRRCFGTGRTWQEYNELGVPTIRAIDCPDCTLLRSEPADREGE